MKTEGALVIVMHCVNPSVLSYSCFTLFYYIKIKVF